LIQSQDLDNFWASGYIPYSIPFFELVRCSTYSVTISNQNFRRAFSQIYDGRFCEALCTKVLEMN